MKLSDNIKNKINQYFETHSEDEVKEAFKSIGLTLDEPKILTDDDMSPINALKNLHKDIYNKGEYLRECTYSEYDHCFEFASRLNKIIKRITE